MAYAAVLQFVRTRRGLLQQDIAVHVTHSHVSQLEAVKTSPTLEANQDLASALSLNPVTLLTLVQASYEKKSAREILQMALQELEELALLDEPLPTKPKKLRPPRTVESEKKIEAIHRLKGEGFTQAEVVQMLGIPKTTVGRNWHKKLGTP
jgi:transcriptional regulator with XRE-family HTH domain